MAEELCKLATKYFEVWNTHNGKAVGQLFNSDGTLRDWDIAVEGGDNVGEANGNIFKAVPNIKITVESLHPCESKRTVACEILVHLNNDTHEVLKVVDIIEFTTDGKIKALRAYKG
mmetsp:Transcript_24379/g.33584  ORF Transcript_24379/g.33584 Transcript_24379/m.33584 type:complete len:116 (+) Transcript_24379:122-469(+)|eukprot:CAMPEP_0196595200 /NCGR_PEP_ID=MMETSP1081-20130531/80466_1 /TAXON_ID=36882 /ORGANISM="Pyramimonas amylifera, Strain CCMP720" /LENGTH=115 /DNA_ID=CAMNT_0041919701 /DNA_START=120 /DNA_END=467 /DNA_ORIENTATION=-